MNKPTKLEQLRDSLIRHKKFVTAIKNVKDAPEYWIGYEDAIRMFEEKIEILLRSDNKYNNNYNEE